MDIAARRRKCQALVHKYYANVPNHESLLQEQLGTFLRPHVALLDAGCGNTYPLLEKYGPGVCFGIGVDRARPPHQLAGHLTLVVADLGALPFKPATFEVVVSRSVLEHLEAPLVVFRELRRVLKPSGKIVLTTPNKYDYGSVVARMIPYTWKSAYLRWVFGENAYEDFPVLYRANTRRAFQRIACDARLRIRTVRAVRHYPYYLVFSPMLFRLGMLYDWLITALRLDALQSTWLVVMERTD